MSTYSSSRSIKNGGNGKKASKTLRGSITEGLYLPRTPTQNYNEKVAHWMRYSGRPSLRERYFSQPISFTDMTSHVNKTLRQDKEKSRRHEIRDHSKQTLDEKDLSETYIRQEGKHRKTSPNHLSKMSMASDVEMKRRRRSPPDQTQESSDSVASIAPSTSSDVTITSRPASLDQYPSRQLRSLIESDETSGEVVKGKDISQHTSPSNSPIKIGRNQSGEVSSAGSKLNLSGPEQSSSNKGSPRLTGLNSPRLTGLNSPPITGLRSPRLTGSNSPPITGLRSPLLTGLNSPPVIGLNSPPITGLSSPRLTGLSSPPITVLSSPRLTGVTRDTSHQSPANNLTNIPINLPPTMLAGTISRNEEGLVTPQTPMSKIQDQPCVPPKKFYKEDTFPFNRLSGTIYISPTSSRYWSPDKWENQDGASCNKAMCMPGISLEADTVPDLSTDPSQRKEDSVWEDTSSSSSLDYTNGHQSYSIQSPDKRQQPKDKIEVKSPPATSDAKTGKTSILGRVNKDGNIDRSRPKRVHTHKCKRKKPIPTRALATSDTSSMANPRTSVLLCGQTAVFTIGGFLIHTPDLVRRFVNWLFEVGDYDTQALLLGRVTIRLVSLWFVSTFVTCLKQQVLERYVYNRNTLQSGA